MDAKEQKIQQLKEYFEKRDDIVMAFLFGSQAKERTHRHSDWDIAVYFKPEVERVEWEEYGREYPEEDHVWSDCMKILNTDDADLIVLNRAAANIADAAIHGMPLVIKDRKLWLDFMLIITREAEDYRRFVHEFYEIAQRSQSLTGQDKENLEKTIYFVETELKRYEEFKKMAGDEYQRDPRARNDVERWVEKIVMACVDIAKIMLSSAWEPIPDKYTDIFLNTGRFLELPQELGEKFEKWIRLRNVLAHEYLDIKWKRLSNFIQESESYIRTFIEATKRFLTQHE